MPISADQLEVVLRIFDDRRALIAAGKLMRWEVVKWGLTVNLALGAAAASPNLHSVGFFLFLLALATSGMGVVLLWHYNSRMTKVRASLQSINQYLKREFIDIDIIAADKFSGKEITPDYDQQEMRIFYASVLLSIIPALVAILN